MSQSVVSIKSMQLDAEDEQFIEISSEHLARKFPIQDIPTLPKKNTIDHKIYIKMTSILSLMFGFRKLKTKTSLYQVVGKLYDINQNKQIYNGKSNNAIRNQIIKINAVKQLINRQQLVRFLQSTIIKVLFQQLFEKEYNK